MAKGNAQFRSPRTRRASWMIFPPRFILGGRCGRIVRGRGWAEAEDEDAPRWIWMYFPEPISWAENLFPGQIGVADHESGVSFLNFEKNF